MNALELTTNQKYSNKKPIIKITNWMRNQIANLYNALSAPIAATRDTLAERLHSVRETASSLYNRMMDNNEHGWERLKDIVWKKQGKKRKKLKTQGEEQTEDNIDLTAAENQRTWKGAHRTLHKICENRGEYWSVKIDILACFVQWKLCDTWYTKSWNRWLCWSSQTTYQGVNCG